MFIECQVPYFYTNTAFIPPHRVPGLSNINFRCVLEEGLYQVGQRPAESLYAHPDLNTVKLQPSCRDMYRCPEWCSCPCYTVRMSFHSSPESEVQ